VTRIRKVQILNESGKNEMKYTAILFFFLTFLSYMQRNMRKVYT